ncbi:hypothetical protein K466DRAFT_598667 [Polyporus arcularius HHB13444]|uniref:Uncharacterized protein n=1 Tax=Polyporus arcularius HHB13444 TaxID=1314778 RepID=A0A5C3PJJ6_9APHY|nr:hypothetical protein K466DRAFT_598667 [Polyporus arcularius HHB13444]
MSEGNGGEAMAARLAQELNEAAASDKPSKYISELLTRIKNELVWTAALSRTQSGQALELALRTCTTSPERSSDTELRALAMSVLHAHSDQLREADIQETEARWWHTEPVPEDAERIVLEFRDTTADHKVWPVTEVWPSETVESAPSEPFERAAQRFRVRANQKHRHPFMPSLKFDVVLKTGTVSLDSLGARPTADVLENLVEERVVPFVRNDEDNKSVSSQSPARYFKLWERSLPSWCKTPDHWVEPTPPPGFYENPEAAHALREQYYKKIPTLHVPGSGLHIVPSAKKPDIISRAFFIPVEDFGPNVTRVCALERESDLVPHDAHLVPGKHISLDEARALLGRVVQSSTEPRPDPASPPLGKRRKVNKYATQKLGLAWGLEIDVEGKPGWLLCVEFHGLNSEYALDLSGENRQYEDARSPIAVRTVACAWVGAAVLPADKKAMKGAEEQKVEQTAGPTPVQALPGVAAEKQILSYDDWYKRTSKWIRALNKKKAPLVEVGPDGAFVGGDLGTSKGEDDEFEVEITGAKPGVWLASVNAAEPEEGDEDGMGDEPKLIRFVWVRDGTVNYDALPSRASVQVPPADAEANWEVVASFSVDSGTVCLFSKHALDSVLATGTDREAMLEAFIDDDEGTNVFVPGGVVLSGNDGGYEIRARRDAEGRIVELNLRV